MWKKLNKYVKDKIVCSYWDIDRISINSAMNNGVMAVKSNSKFQRFMAW